MSVLAAAPRDRRPLAVLGVAALGLALAGAFLPLRTIADAPAAPAPAGRAALDAERRAFLEGGRIELSAILATPAYLRATGQLELAERYRADRDVVVIAAEDVHRGELPAPLAPALVVDGVSYSPARTDVLVRAPHHRVTALVYAGAAPLVDPRVGVAELAVAGASGALRWERPFGGAGEGAGLSVPLVLALLGGMLASMWPCLFQLTAYFLPAVAGLSLDDARAGTARASVVRTAVLFVSGIVVVYTAAGLVAGLAARSLSASAAFEASRAPLTFAAGLVIVGMAARIALRARRPLACAMPIAAPTRASAARTVVLGLAFATGCMTCFGAAVVLGMFTYVVTTASPLVGALVLFIFSL
ncbi:MAG TPA: cytochrome c biogenesis protein CcdA, partial [Gaiellaceae bacterium]|nr:cytochrome c biogenesis protein CcdA [Gaiellaceae bacterium]